MVVPWSLLVLDFTTHFLSLWIVENSIFGLVVGIFGLGLGFCRLGLSVLEMVILEMSRILIVSLSLETTGVRSTINDILKVIQLRKQ